ncbi:MAG: hypothetical protein QXD77_03255 [Candidatus Aenigmatarchaeota archaeon]
MAFYVFSIIILFFPVALLGGGAYLIMKGLANLSISRRESGILLSGVATCAAPFKSHLSEQPCVYSKVVVEEQVGGHTPWRHIKTIEKKVPFSVDGHALDTSRAVFQLSNCRVYQGYAKVEQNELLRMPGSLIEEQKELLLRGVLDAKVQSAIVRHGGEEIRRHLRKTLRVQEFVIPEGAAVHVLGSARPAPYGNRQMLSGEMIITDSGEETAQSYFREKAYLGIILGVVLALLSLLLFFVLFSSM